jgi:hypothetical protein
MQVARRFLLAAGAVFLVHLILYPIIGLWPAVSLVLSTCVLTMMLACKVI